MAFKHMSTYKSEGITNIGCVKNKNKYSLMILEN